MSDYSTILDGASGLDQINSAIVREERTGAEFLKAEIVQYHGRSENQCTFRDLEAGRRPAKDVVLLLQVAPAPGGRTRVWSGDMMVAGAKTALAAYR